MKSSKAVILAAVFSMLSSNALAQTIFQDSGSSPLPGTYGPSMWSIVVKLVFSMILIVGLIYLSMNFLKKLNARSSKGEALGDFVKVLNRTFIAPKQSLLVVRIGDKYAVLSATESNISLIREVNQEEIDKLDKIGKSGDTSPRQKFTDIFKGMIKS
jgi:flagellar biosynthetic protein FliO